jgi:RNA polymerase sigma-70 factor (ECF subfamily)
MQSDTQQIALGLRQGDVVVLEALVEQYQYRLVRYLIYLLGRRDGVDDLVQETWLRVLERGSSYDGQARFEPWLFRVARNIALDAMRKRQNLSLDSDDEDGRVLRFQEDLSLQEISAIVGAPVSTVASRIYRGLATLRPQFEGETA